MSPISIVAILLVASSCGSRREPSPEIDDGEKRSAVKLEDPKPGTALLHLLTLRTSENKAELERAIQYFAKRNCGAPTDGPAIDIDTFYPLELISQAVRVRCGEFQLRNHNHICGAGPKARGSCVDVIYSDYDENGNPK